jgi:curved DNA-binding protein CbpA
MIDYYELLQISPNADSDTIHRVYRYLAGRFHPDNATTGDALKFQLVKTAYEVLSHPTRRTEFDAARKGLPSRPQQPPLSSSIDFMDQLEGELNRRIAVLAVLYYRRRLSPQHPDVSLAEIEERMGFPREYLDFTLWYLVKKTYVSRADNVTFALTAEGVDFVERERAVLPMLNGLLTSESESSIWDAAQANEETAVQELEALFIGRPSPASPTGILSSSQQSNADLRTGKRERRAGATDVRFDLVERRKKTGDRRANGKGRTHGK